MAELPVGIGDVVAGKYRVERVLGEGGMGIVAAARHVHLDERVALKFLHGESALLADLVARFQREARMSAKIKSDHVVRVTDVGELESGAPYMVMEYLEGEDLATIVDRGPPLSIARAVDLVLQACEAIAEAHALGIVHRDLKPSNLFVTRQRDGAPFVKVLDFGISKVAKREPGELTLTRTNALLGSPCYMSPEQMLDSGKVDARSDIWATGVVLYEILASRPPFEGTTVPEISAKIAASPHTPIQRLRPDVPDALAAVIDRTLAKKPEDRYASVADLARALLPFAPAESAPSVRRIEATVPASDPRLSAADRNEATHALAHGKTVAADARSSPARTTRGEGRVRFALAGALAVLAVGGLTGVAWSLSRHAIPKEEPGAASSPQPTAAPAPPPSSAMLASTAIAIPSSARSAPASVVAKTPHATTRPAVAAQPPPTVAPAQPPPTASQQPFDSRK